MRASDRTLDGPGLGTGAQHLAGQIQRAADDHASGAERQRPVQRLATEAVGMAPKPRPWATAAKAAGSAAAPSKAAVKTWASMPFSA